MNRHQLDHDLSTLTFDLRRLGSNAEEQTVRAVSALLQRDATLASNVIAWDKQANALRYKIEREALSTIATQQPTARDLRRVLATAQMASELERMADHASGIAELALRLNDVPTPEISVDIPRMQVIVCDMMRQAIHAFVSHDVALARTVATADDEVDGLYVQTLRVMLTYMMQDARLIQGATYLVWVAHNLERIGDRATNLADKVLFAEGEARRGGSPGE